MDAPQWSQQVITSSLPKQMEEITSPTPPNNTLTNPIHQQQQDHQRRTRPQKDQFINCPRCNSTNTKFCYYNNYSLTQPRYFCKTCRRYWTQGGSLRSVPVGGGSRKNKRSSSSSSLSSSSSSPRTAPPPMHHHKLINPDLNPNPNPPTSLSHLLNSSTHQNPNLKFLPFQGHDLNLAFPIQGLFHPHIDHQLPKIDEHNNHKETININSNSNHNNNNSSPTNASTITTSTPISALELLRSRGTMNHHPFIPISMSDPNALYQSGYPNLQEFKPNMNIFSSPTPTSVEHNPNMVLQPDNNNDNDNDNNVDTTIGGGGARLLFPFADMNKLATHTHHHQQQEQHQDDHNRINDQINSKGSTIDNNDDHNNNSNSNNNHSSYWNGMFNGGTWQHHNYQ